MKTKTKTKAALRFADLPADYAGLCRLLIPRTIHDAAEYAAVVEITDAMAVHASAFTADQEDYFDLLASLLERWDAEHVKWKKFTPLKLLQHLLDEHGLSGADLSAILGASRNLGPMILRGDREITASHARALGARFGLPAGTFIA